MNQREIRIVKLYQKGMGKTDIARRIGYGGDIPSGIKKINEILNKFKSAK